MIAILKGIDTFLEAACLLRSVRWLLIVTITTLIVVAGFSMARKKVLSLQLAAAKGQTAMYVSALKMQNDAILKDAEDAKKQQQVMDVAATKAAAMEKALKEWRKRFSQIELVGTCDQMVDQVIAAVKE